MTMPVFVIGLRRHPERHQKTLARLEDLGVDAQFFEGADLPGGDTLAPEEKVFKYKRLLSLGRELTLGDAGCYFAHYRLLKHILARGCERAVVMECDAIPRPAFRPLLEQVETLDAERYELIYLFHHSQTTRTFRRRSDLRFARTPEYALHLAYGPVFSTVAYAITRGGIEKLLPRLIPMTAPIDAVMGKPFLNGLRSYVIAPAGGAVTHTAHTASIVRTSPAYYGPKNPSLARLDRCFCSAVKPLARCWRPAAERFSVSRLRRRNYIRRFEAAESARSKTP